MQTENSLREFSDTIKCSNIHIIGISEEDREKGAEILFEKVIAENIPNLRKETSRSRRHRDFHPPPPQIQPKEVHTKKHSN